MASPPDKQTARDKLEEEYREAFKTFDKDNDGTITIIELKYILTNLGFHLSDADMNKVWNEVDTDCSGTIDFEEFISLVKGKLQSKKPVSKDDELRRTFKLFDKDGSGTISKSELKSVLLSLGHRLSDEEITEMMKEADTDGDGEVNFDEFRNMLQ